MKLLLKRIALFFIPLGLYLLTVIIIDPYNHVRVCNLINDEIKSEISYKIHYPLWKLNNYHNRPVANILLGDSRVNSISTDLLAEKTNESFANLAYGGSSIREMIATFWEASKLTKLKKVYFGLNFNQYNAYNQNNRVKDALALNENFFSYSLNRYTFKSTWFILYATLFGAQVEFENPNMTNNEFWEYQKTVFIKGFYEFYEYPTDYYEELKKIALYCKKEGIQLVFFIPPTHIELQDKVAEFSLIEEEMKFISDLNSIGTLYNFDYPSKITKNRNNFKDPFHLHDSLFNSMFIEMLKKEQMKIKE